MTAVRAAQQGLIGLFNGARPELGQGAAFPAATVRVVR